MADKYDSGPAPLERQTRIVEMKVPLTWLLSSCGAIFLALASMFFNVERMREDMTELKGAVKVWNGQTSTQNAEMALMKFRLETLEADQKLRDQERRSHK